MRNNLFKGIGTLILLLVLHLQSNAGTHAPSHLDAALVPGPISPLTDTVCPYGDPILFTSQPPTGASGTVTYQWQFQPGCSGPWTDIPGANTLSYDPPAGLTTSTCFRLALTDNLGTEFSDSVSVIVRPGPTAVLTPDGNPVICEGDQFWFFASGGASYIWLTNGVPSSQTTSDSAFFALQGNYSVIAIDSFGCRDTSQTYALTWYPPLVTVSIAPSTGLFMCFGDTLPLNAQTTGPVTGYQWLLDPLTPIPGETASTFNANTYGSYQVAAYDTNGCSVLSDPVNIAQGSNPTAVIFPPDDDLLCPGESIVLTGTRVPFNSGLGVLYQWFLDGNPIPGATDTTYVAMAGGAYTLEVRTACGSDTSEAQVLLSAGGPTAAFWFENYPQDEVLFYNESTDEVAWRWELDGIVSLQEHIYHSFPGPGTYPVTLVVRDSLGCTDTLTLEVSVTDPDFFVPNVFTPNDDGINDVARTRFLHLNAIDFAIFDRWGNKIFISNSPDVYWDGKIEGKPAPEGVYYYYFRALDVRGKEISKSGNISLLR